MSANRKFCHRFVTNDDKFGMVQSALTQELGNDLDETIFNSIFSQLLLLLTFVRTYNANLPGDSKKSLIKS